MNIFSRILGRAKHLKDSKAIEELKNKIYSLEAELCKQSDEADNFKKLSEKQDGELQQLRADVECYHSTEQRLKETTELLLIFAKPFGDMSDKLTVALGELNEFEDKAKETFDAIAKMLNKENENNDNENNEETESCRGPTFRPFQLPSECNDIE